MASIVHTQASWRSGSRAAVQSPCWRCNSVTSRMRCLESLSRFPSLLAASESSLSSLIRKAYSLNCLSNFNQVIHIYTNHQLRQPCLVDSPHTVVSLLLAVSPTTSTAREVTQSLQRRRLSVCISKVQTATLANDKSRRCCDRRAQAKRRLPRTGQGIEEGWRGGLRGSARPRRAIRTSIIV